MSTNFIKQAYDAALDIGIRVKIIGVFDARERCAVELVSGLLDVLTVLALLALGLVSFDTSRACFRESKIVYCGQPLRNEPLRDNSTIMMAVNNEIP